MELQQEFKAWRKHLRSVEMKILDELHNDHFPEFEEKFQSAKSENQSLLSSVTSLIDDTQKILDFTAKNIALNKHYIEYSLTDPENLDLILSRAENHLENILNLREFDDLKDLDEKYNKINVKFDCAFETMALKLVEVEGVIPKRKERSNSPRTRSQKLEISADETAQLSFKEELGELGMSNGENTFDITRISDSSEQRRAHLVKPQTKNPQARTSLVGNMPPIVNNLQIDSSDTSGSQRNNSTSGAQFAAATTDSSNSMNISYGQ